MSKITKHVTEMPTVIKSVRESLQFQFHAVLSSSLVQFEL